jgi:hypothetical protein
VVGEYDMRVGSEGEMVIPEYLKNGSAQMPDQRQAASNATGGDYDGMYKLNRGQGAPVSDMAQYKYGAGFENSDAASISVELGTDANVDNLESLWSDLSRKYASILNGYQPFYSVDAPADGQGRELFHLRIGPVPSIDVGDGICSQLGRNGIFCSVVRIQ